MAILWVLTFTSALAWSAYQPKDLFTWFLEVFPSLVAVTILAATRRRFPLTPMLYVLILAHSIILMVGGHYTYAEVPLFDWLKEVFGWERNNYDKLGHFTQGFVPALVAREIFVRRNIVNGRGWLGFIVVSICLAISAFYELIEWWVAVLSGTGADAFLGTQGYAWDTQSDMLWALVGAVSAVFVMSNFHDRQLAAIKGTSSYHSARE